MPRQLDADVLHVLGRRDRLLKHARPCDTTKPPSSARPGPPLRQRLVRQRFQPHRRDALQVGAAACTVYVSVSGFVPDTSTEPSSRTVHVAPPCDVTSRRSQRLPVDFRDDRCFPFALGRRQRLRPATRTRASSLRKLPIQLGLQLLLLVGRRQQQRLLVVAVGVGRLIEEREQLVIFALRERIVLVRSGTGSSPSSCPSTLASSCSRDRSPPPRDTPRRPCRLRRSASCCDETPWR